MALPDELWCSIAEYLPAKSICSMSATNSVIRTALRDELFWMALCRRDFEISEKMRDTWRETYQSYAGLHDVPLNVLLVTGGSGKEYTHALETALLDCKITATVWEIRDHGGQLPKLADLLSYDCVLTYTDCGFADKDVAGDLFANYVDQNRGLVVAALATGKASLGGRFINQSFQPYTPGGQDASQLKLGTRLLPRHPLLYKIDDGLNGNFFYSADGFEPGTTAVANWSNGKPLLGLRAGPTGGCVVLLNLLPVLGYMDAATCKKATVTQLVANTLRVAYFGAKSRGQWLFNGAEKQ
eukprot:TRINITY_DN11166_c0_g1_i1.p1 TRINITY_DN11166_c0_g1~~TRINITY_DN11166_c0_g1_i1.p1  ORF type:complete len:305 (-),score=51.36 TRINITY_DN11166_c0_g1_i1:73-966(-)